MIKILSAIFIKSRDFSNPEVCRYYGILCGGVGIFLNLLLFVFKFIAGTLCGSVAITADAFNNLSDGGSSLISLIGFKISGKKPDPDHPFGHGRYEHIAGLIVSFLVILMGTELAKTSVGKIISLDTIEFSVLSIAILCASIIIKLYMAYYNFSVGKKVQSSSMKATGTDSISDALSTTIILASMMLSEFADINIDAWCGCLVSIFIIVAGIRAAKDTISPLLGQKAKPETIKEITQIVLGFPEAIGIHDLVVHDYGCGAMMVSLHVEVDANGNILDMHDAIDNMEREIAQRLSCNATIHMDPVEKDNPEIESIKSFVGEYLSKHFDGISMHDFRMVKGQTHTNIIFDILVPYSEKNPERVTDALKKRVTEYNSNYFAVINVDRNF